MNTHRTTSQFVALALMSTVVCAVVALTPPSSGGTAPSAITPPPTDYWKMLTNPTPPLSMPIPAECSFDLDDDGDVDQSDFGLMQACLGKYTDPACARIDLERDGDVGELEQIYFRLCASGPAIPADPICQTFELKGQFEKLGGAAESNKLLRFIGTGKFKGQDYCTHTDRWGGYSIRIPAGWTGYYTVCRVIDASEQIVMATFLIATRDAEEFDRLESPRPNHQEN